MKSIDMTKRIKAVRVSLMRMRNGTTLELTVVSGLNLLSLPRRFSRLFFKICPFFLDIPFLMKERKKPYRLI